MPFRYDDEDESTQSLPLYEPWPPRNRLSRCSIATCRENQEQFLSIALQVAAGEARSGRKETAEQLRGLVQAARGNPGRLPRRETDNGSAIPIARPRGELQTLLSVEYPKVRLADMVLGRRTAGRLREIIQQQTQRDLLRQHGKAPSCKLLLAGPPGSGMRQ
jgi:hypothetical protein